MEWSAFLKALQAFPPPLRPPTPRTPAPFSSEILDTQKKEVKAEPHPQTEAASARWADGERGAGRGGARPGAGRALRGGRAAASGAGASPRAH